MPGLNPDYCGSTGTFTLTGQYRRGRSILIPHENCPLTLFVKRCSGPQKQICAHQTAPGTPYYVGSVDYCADGTIETQSVTTDCSGNYTATVSGSILAVGLAVGVWVGNPAFSCSAPPPTVDPNSTDWLPYIPDPSTAVRYGCPKDIGAEGSALASGGGLGLPVGDLYPDEVGGVTDGSNVGGACGFIVPGTICLACKYTTGSFYVTNPTTVEVTRPGDGTVQLQPQSLDGTYTLDFWENFYSAGLVAYYTLDGKYYMVGGVKVHLTDACGLTETVTSDSYPGTAPLETVDWPNISTVTVSNWPGDCSPPINTVFSGPEGPLFVSGPYTGPPGPQIPAQTAQLYPVLEDLTRFCISSSMVFGVKLQVCTGAVAERLQADSYGDILALAWVTGGALYTACHRSPSRYIGNSTQGWEAAQTVESANADDIGMVFLPNESLYLTYLLSGPAVYRENKSFGAYGAWAPTHTPNPAVARHSASGRGQEQAFRLRALGSASVNGALEFSQCRDNRGALWTDPRTVTSYAQGPYCGGIWLQNGYGALFSLAADVIGVGAAGELMWTESADGGETWSAPASTGFFGQCSSIVRTAQGIFVACVWGVEGSQNTGFLQSRNNGRGWHNDFVYGTAVPPLEKPPVLAAIEDTVYCLWVTGDQPQYVASSDGGVSWY